MTCEWRRTANGDGYLYQCTEFKTQIWLQYFHVEKFGFCPFCGLHLAIGERMSGELGKNW